MSSSMAMNSDQCDWGCFFLSFLVRVLPAPSPALPEAMAGATSMGGYLATARATQLVDIVR